MALLAAPLNAIEYLYGKIPLAVDGLPAFALPSPRYVLVTQSIDTSVTMGRHLRWADGHWQYRAHFQCHALALEVDTNVSGNATTRLGKSILGLERCNGK